MVRAPINDGHSVCLVLCMSIRIRKEQLMRQLPSTNTLDFWLPDEKKKKSLVRAYNVNRLVGSVLH